MIGRVRVQRHCPNCDGLIPLWYTGKYCLNADCALAKPRIGRKAARIVSRPHPTHVAGYVPPKGSVAMEFFGHVVRPR